MFCHLLSSLKATEKFIKAVFDYTFLSSLLTRTDLLHTSLLVNVILPALISNKLSHIVPLGNPLPTACTSIFGLYRWNTLVAGLLSTQHAHSLEEHQVLRKHAKGIRGLVLSRFAQLCGHQLL